MNSVVQKIGCPRPLFGLLVLGMILVGEPLHAQQIHKDSARSSQVINSTPVSLIASEQGSLPAHDSIISLGRGPVTLSLLIDEARRANPDLRAAYERYQAALQIPEQARTLEDPTLSFSYSPQPTQTRSGPIDYRIGIRQMIPFYGVLDLREEAAARMAKSENSRAEMTDLDLIREVKLVFFDWLYARRALEINSTNRTLLVQFKRIAEQRYRAGLVPQSDPLKAAVALAKIDALDATYLRMDEVAKALLNTLLNREPGAPLGLPEHSGQSPDGLEARALAQAALKHRPEIAGAGERLAAKDARLNLAHKDYWPSLTVGADYAIVDGGTNAAFPKDGDDVVSATVGINVPIQLGRRSSAVSEAAHERAAAEAELQGVRNRVLFEVHDRYLRVHEAAEILRLYQNNIVPASKLELEATRKAYENARVDFLNLLDSERSYEEILLQEAAAYRNMKQQIANLERAIGVDISEVLPWNQYSE